MRTLNEYIVEGLFDNKLLKPLRDFIQRNFKKRVGFKEMITICVQGDKYEFSATIDTGNGGVVPTLGVDKMNIDGDKVTITIGDKEYTFDKKGEASPTVGNVVHHRPIIIIDYIKIGGRKLDEPFIAVTDERKKSTKTLINRDTMTKLNLVVDPSKNNLIKESLSDSDIDKVKKFLINRYHVSTWEECIDAQKFGQCTKLVKSIWEKFYTMFDCPVEIKVDFSKQAQELINDDDEMCGNHYVLKKDGKYYDFARGANCINGIYTLTQNNNKDKYDIILTKEEEDCINYKWKPNWVPNDIFKKYQTDKHSSVEWKNLDKDPWYRKFKKLEA